MARAGEGVGTRNPGVSHGICLGVYPSTDPDPHVEIQRTTAAGGSTAGGVAYQVVGVVDVQGGERTLQYRDPLPADNKTYWYRARSIRQNYTASVFTLSVSGTPSKLQAGDYSHPAVRASAALSSALAFGVGTYTTVAWTNDSYDYGGMWDGSGRHLVAPYADVYDASLTIQYSSAGRGTGTPNFLFDAAIYHGGDPVAHAYISAHTTDTKAGTVSCSQRLNLRAGDEVGVVVSAPSGGGISGQLQLETGSFLTLSRV